MCNIQHSDSEGVSFDTGESIPIPAKIQIVDQETQTGVKPHTLYVILTWWEGDGEQWPSVCIPLFILPPSPLQMASQRQSNGKLNPIHVAIQPPLEGGYPLSISISILSTSLLSLCHRRFKEFDELDTRLKQFYGTTNGWYLLPPLPFSLLSRPADVKLPALPSKRTLRNMDSSFVAARSRDLEAYLQGLLQFPQIQNSQLLASFLSDTSDRTLFMPDSMGERAGTFLLHPPYLQSTSCSSFSGKMIKSVPVPGRNKEVRHSTITSSLHHTIFL